MHREPPVRAAAAGTLAARSDAAHRLAALVDASDDGVHAVALKAIAAADSEQAVRGFLDPSPVVRGAALEAATTSGNETLVENAMRALVQGGFADTLHQTCRRNSAARQTLLAMLRKPGEISAKALLMILEALSHAVDTQHNAPAGSVGEEGSRCHYGHSPLVRRARQCGSWWAAR